MTFIVHICSFVGMNVCTPKVPLKLKDLVCLMDDKKKPILMLEENHMKHSTPQMQLGLGKMRSINHPVIYSPVSLFKICNHISFAYFESIKRPLTFKDKFFHETTRWGWKKTIQSRRVSPFFFCFNTDFSLELFKKNPGRWKRRNASPPLEFFLIKGIVFH